MWGEFWWPCSFQVTVFPTAVLNQPSVRDTTFSNSLMWSNCVISVTVFTSVIWREQYLLHGVAGMLTLVYTRRESLYSIDALDARHAITFMNKFSSITCCFV